jgi:hypothetical protein
MWRRLTNIHPEKLHMGMTLTGAGFGSCYGGYHGYLESNHRPFRRNVEESVVGMCTGTIYGGITGFLWPVTVPAMTSVYLSRRMWPTPPQK